ncbi:MAG: OmpH family outer membrane protein [bacterium]|nr:OmpH family outer membrane protein [bacterium]MDT8365313.1 OmpH family outer membrane protein [bacterium]
MTFKHLALIIAVAGISLTLFTGNIMAASMLKIAVVDLQGALNSTSEGLAAKETLKKKHMAKQEQVDKMKAELDTMEEKIKSPVLSQEAQTELKEKYRVTKAQLIEYVTLAKEEEERENQQLSSRILEGLIKIAREIAEAENFTIVLEKSGSAVVYFEDNMDITDRVVKLYNERYMAGEGQ